MSNLRTWEVRFIGPEHDGTKALFAVRPGQSMNDALEQASTFIDGVERGLAQLAMSLEGKAPDGVLWSLSYTLRMAKALVDSAVDGMPAPQQD